MKRVTLFLRISKPMGQEKSPKVPVCHLFLCVSFIACLLVCVPRCVWTLCVVQAASMRIEAAHRPPTLKPPTDKFKYSLPIHIVSPQRPWTLSQPTHKLKYSLHVKWKIQLQFLDFPSVRNSWHNNYLSSSKTNLTLNISAFPPVRNTQNHELPKWIFNGPLNNNNHLHPNQACTNKCTKN